MQRIHPIEDKCTYPKNGRKPRAPNKDNSPGVRRRLTLTVSNPGPIAAFLTAKFTAAFSRLFDSHNMLRKGFLYRSLPALGRRFLTQTLMLQFFASEMEIRPIT
jgi:hypothetical protein